MTSRAATTSEPDLPGWAIGRVTVVPADPSWAQQGEQECALLRQCLEPWLIAGMHHAGSTAVPGLSAKPIIDVMAGVASLDDLIGVADALGADWHYVPPDLDERPWRRL